MNKITIYLPIEIKVRELNSHVLLSKFASKLGMRIYIGSKDAIKRLLKKKNDKAGAIIVKGGMEMSKLLEIKEKIQKFIILDQEISPSTVDYKKEIRSRVWPGSEKYIDNYYSIGQHAHEAGVDVFKNSSLNITKTGWPRIDLLRNEFKFLYKKKIEKITKQNGNFILFSSDFGYNSTKKIKHGYERMKNSKWDNERNDLEHEMNWATNTLNEFRAYIEFFKQLDNDSSCPQIIIRPHPSEDHEEWYKITKSFKKIKIIYEGDIEPWVYASSALLHRGCMSAINAYMAGIPIGYLRLQKDNVKKALPYELSEHFDNIRDVIKFCKHNINKQPIPHKDYSKVFREYIHIEKKYASEIILEDLSKFKLFYEPPYQSRSKDKFYDILINLKIILKKLFDLFKIEKKIAVAPQSQKMPGGVNAKEIKDILVKLSQSHDFKVSQVFKDCVIIEAK